MYSKTENIGNIEIITWAFEKGYNLSSTNMKEGIHISIAEIKKMSLHKSINYL